MCIITLENLINTKHGQIICYPRYEQKELETRVDEMRKLGVKAVCFYGNKSIMDAPVLGKGYSGIVVLALLEDGRKAALKICRTDSDPRRITHEAKMLQIANSVNVGPHLLGYSDKLLMMNYIEGMLFPDWIEKLSGEKERVFPRLSNVLKDILEQCWRLDSAGLDHGELSWADKHIIVDVEERAHILDFEAASDKRKVANVTSVSQYLFVKSRVAETIAQKFGRIDAEGLIQALRAYKVERSRRNFESILGVLGLLC